MKKIFLLTLLMLLTWGMTSVNAQYTIRYSVRGEVVDSLEDREVFNAAPACLSSAQEGLPYLDNISFKGWSTTEFPKTPDDLIGDYTGLMSDLTVYAAYGSVTGYSTMAKKVRDLMELYQAVANHDLMRFFDGSSDPMGFSDSYDSFEADGLTAYAYTGTVSCSLDKMDENGNYVGMGDWNQLGMYVAAYNGGFIISDQYNNKYFRMVLNDDSIPVFAGFYQGQVDTTEVDKWRWTARFDDDGNAYLENGGYTMTFDREAYAFKGSSTGGSIGFYRYVEETEYVYATNEYRVDCSYFHNAIGFETDGYYTVGEVDTAGNYVVALGHSFDVMAYSKSDDPQYAISYIYSTDYSASITREGANRITVTALHDIVLTGTISEALEYYTLTFREAAGKTVSVRSTEYDNDLLVYTEDGGSTLYIYVAKGHEVELTANLPVGDYIFEQWWDSTTTARYTFTPTEDMEINFTYTDKPWGYAMFVDSEDYSVDAEALDGGLFSFTANSTYLGESAHSLTYQSDHEFRVFALTGDTAYMCVGWEVSNWSDDWSSAPSLYGEMTLSYDGVSRGYRPVIVKRSEATYYDLWYYPSEGTISLDGVGYSDNAYATTEVDAEGKLHLYVAAGTTVRLSATPKSSDYFFDGWWDNADMGPLRTYTPTSSEQIGFSNRRDDSNWNKNWIIQSDSYQLKVFNSVVHNEEFFIYENNFYLSGMAYMLTTDPAASITIYAEPTSPDSAVVGWEVSYWTDDWYPLESADGTLAVGNWGGGLRPVMVAKSSLNYVNITCDNHVMLIDETNPTLVSIAVGADFKQTITAAAGYPLSVQPAEEEHMRFVAWETGDTTRVRTITPQEAMTISYTTEYADWSRYYFSNATQYVVLPSEDYSENDYRWQDELEEFLDVRYHVLLVNPAKQINIAYVQSDKKYHAWRWITKDASGVSTNVTPNSEIFTTQLGYAELNVSPALERYYFYVTPDTTHLAVDWSLVADTSLIRVEYDSLSDNSLFLVRANRNVQLPLMLDTTYYGADAWVNEWVVFDSTAATIARRDQRIVMKPTKDMYIGAEVGATPWYSVSGFHTSNVRYPEESANVRMGEGYDGDNVQLLVKHGTTITLHAIYNSALDSLAYWQCSDNTMGSLAADSVSLTVTSDVRISPVIERKFWCVEIPNAVAYYLSMGAHSPTQYPDAFFSASDFVVEGYTPFFVRKGRTASIGLQDGLDAYTKISQWISRDTACNGKTDQELFFTPTADMELSADVYTYHIAHVYDRDYVEIHAEAADTTTFFWKAGDGLRDLWVRDGSTVRIYPVITDDRYEFQSFETNIPVEAGAAADQLNFSATDESERFFNVVPVVEKAWHVITLASGSHIVIDYASLDEDYREWLRMVAVGTDSVVYVRPNHMVYYKIDPAYTNANAVTYWTTSDGYYIDMPVQTLYFNPTADVTLSATTVKWYSVSGFSSADVLYTLSDDVIMGNSSDPTNTELLVKEGATLTLIASYLSLDSLAYWRCSDNSVGRLTTDTISLVVNSDITIVPVFERLYWPIMMPTATAEQIAVSNTELQVIWRANEEDGYTILWVPNDNTVTLVPVQGDAYCRVDRWISDDEAINGSTEQSITIEPNAEGIELGVEISKWQRHEVNLDAAIDYIIERGEENTDYMVEEEILYVRQGHTVCIGAYHASPFYELQYWTVDGTQLTDSVCCLYADSTNMAAREVSATFEEVWFAITSDSTRLIVNGDALTDDSLNKWLLEAPQQNGTTLFYVRTGHALPLMIDLDYYHKMEVDEWISECTDYTLSEDGQTFFATPTRDMVVDAKLKRKYDWFSITRLYGEGYSVDVNVNDSTILLTENNELRVREDAELTVGNPKSDILTEEFTSWLSTVDTLNGDTAHQLTFTPTTDMTLTPQFANAYWTIEPNWIAPIYEIFVDDEAMGNYQPRYFEGEDDLIYVHFGDSVLVDYDLLYGDDILESWKSDDARYNGRTEEAIWVAADSNIQLGVQLTSAYYTIYLGKESTYNLNDTLRIAFKGWSDDSDPLPAIERKATPKTHFDMINCDSAECDYVIRAVKGEALTLYMPWLATTNAYSFDHWTSTDAAIDSLETYPLVYTPTSDVRLFGSVKALGALTVVNGVAIVYNDTNANAAIDLLDNGSAVLTMNPADDAPSVLDLVNAVITGAGVETGLTELVVNVASSSIIQPTESEVAIAFTGEVLTLSTDTNLSLLAIQAPTPIQGNGLNALEIAAQLVISSDVNLDVNAIVDEFRISTGTLDVNKGSFNPGDHYFAPQRLGDDRELKPAISGFSDVRLLGDIELMEAWYGEEKGDINATRFHAEEGMYGTVDIETQSFVPATTLVFADPSFYVDYLEGKIEVDVTTGLLHFRTDAGGSDAQSLDNGYYDVLGRPIGGPQPGIYIHRGQVYLGK